MASSRDEMQEMQQRLDDLQKDIDAARQQARSHGLLPEDESDESEDSGDSDESSQSDEAKEAGDQGPTLADPDPDRPGDEGMSGQATG